MIDVSLGVAFATGGCDGARTRLRLVTVVVSVVDAVVVDVVVVVASPSLRANRPVADR